MIIKNETFSLLMKLFIAKFFSETINLVSTNICFNKHFLFVIDTYLNHSNNGVKIRSVMNQKQDLRVYMWLQQYSTTRPILSAWGIPEKHNKDPVEELYANQNESHESKKDIFRYYCWSGSRKI